MDLVQTILENKKSVREIIDETVVANAVAEADQADEPIETALGDEQVSDEGDYRHLFVRRWKKGEEKPYKRVKMTNAIEAINLFLQWADHYRQDRVEIWTDVASDAKNFYRFALKNREAIEPLWRGSMRVKKDGILWPAAYREIQGKARQSGTNLVGSLSPFEVAAK